MCALQARSGSDDFKATGGRARSPRRGGPQLLVEPPADMASERPLDGSVRSRADVYNPSRKREELPMSEDALRNWWWTGVVVFGLALWIIAYMAVPTW